MTNENRKANKTKFLAKLILIALLLTGTVLSGCEWNLFFDWNSTISRTSASTHSDYADIVWQEKSYWSGDISAPFIPGELMVLMDPALSAPQKVHSPDFFKGVEVEMVTDCDPSRDPEDHPEGYKQTLHLTLSKKYNTKQKTLEAMHILECIVGIQYVGPNLIWELDTVANDQYYSFSEDATDQWALEVIDIEKVWRISTGNNSIRIGIVDTGIAAHQDLDGNYNTSNALDFYDTSVTTPSIGKTDTNSHGTHVAGIVGAVGNNTIGISGVNWDISLVQMRAVGTSSNLAIVNAINKAITLWNTEDRISIINYSAGSYVSSGDIENAIRSYCEKGGLFICSTGNLSQNNDEEGKHHYPSFYGSSLYENPIDNMITVGRTDINDDLPNDANWGEDSIMIYAPGEDILSTFPSDICIDYSGDYVSTVNAGRSLKCESSQSGLQWYRTSTHLENGYHYMSGSSMSTPHVSGVAALLLSLNPNLTALQLKQCILDGADYITITLPDGSTQLVKRLNAFGAFKQLLKNYAPSVTLGQNTAQATITTNRQSTYALEKKPVVTINVPYNEEFTFTVSGVGSKVNMVLYDAQMNPIITENTWLNNQWTVKFTEELSKGTYYLMTYYENTTGGSSLNLSVSHEHTIDDYIIYSDTHHQEACACGYGAGELSPHVAKTSGVSLGKGICMYCGAPLDLYNNGFPSIMSITKYSINGSYILPNGIIVLVDEDIEAYENGTLVFYDKDKLPVTL